MTPLAHLRGGGLVEVLVANEPAQAAVAELVTGGADGVVVEVEGGVEDCLVRVVRVEGVAPEDIVSVALMPCTAKKYECNRPEMCDSGFKDVDYGMTTRELSRMIHQAGIDLPAMPETEFDDPFGGATGSGVIFGATGGVMESALRCVIELVTGKTVENFYDHANIIPIRGMEGLRLVEIPINEVGPVPGIIKHLVPNWDWLLGAKLRVGVAHGTANAHKVLEDIKAGVSVAVGRGQGAGR